MKHSTPLPQQPPHTQYGVAPRVCKIHTILTIHTLHILPGCLSPILMSKRVSFERFAAETTRVQDPLAHDPCFFFSAGTPPPAFSYEFIMLVVLRGARWHADYLYLNSRQPDGGHTRFLCSPQMSENGAEPQESCWLRRPFARLNFL